MRGRAIAILTLLLIALASTSTFEARQNGIGNVEPAGCNCHGGMTDDTVITVDGLPDIFNASEEYLFTLTISNDKVPATNPDQNGGFRIFVEDGVGTLESLDVEDSSDLEIDGGLSHNMEINDRRSWSFKWTAPADDTAIANFVIYGNAVNGCLLYTSDAADE